MLEKLLRFSFILAIFLVANTGASFGHHKPDHKFLVEGYPFTPANALKIHWYSAYQRSLHDDFVPSAAGDKS